MNHNKEVIFDEALSLHQQGSLEKAKELYKQILEIDSDHFDTLHLTGMIENQQGNYQKSILLIEKAISLNPNVDFFYNNLGKIYLTINNYENALINFKKAITLNKNFEDAYFNLGECYRFLKKYSLSVKNYDFCLVINPSNILAIINKGVCLFESNAFDECIDIFDQAIQLDTSNLTAISNKALVLIKLKNFKKAYEVYETFLIKNPEQYQIYLLQSKVLIKLEKYKLALDKINKFIFKEPETFEGHYLKGNILGELSDYENSILAYNQAININLSSYDAWNNIGGMHYLNEDFNSAIDSYKQAVKLNPSSSKAFYNLGKSYLEKSRYKLSLESFSESVRLQNDYADAYNYIGIINKTLNKVEDAFYAFEKAYLLKPDNNTLLSNFLFSSMNINKWNFNIKNSNVSISDTNLLKKINVPFISITSIDDPKFHYNVAKNYTQNKHKKKRGHSTRKLHTKRNKINVGYFSSDFGMHPVSFLIIELIENHDRNFFQVFGFSTKQKSPDDFMAKRMASAFDKFYNVEELTSKKIADLSIENEIDIAVDLNGHTLFARTDIFAYGAAAIQINFLGFPSTMGANYYDYIIADKIVIPKETKKYYSEHIVYLPNSYQPNPSSRTRIKKHLTRSDFGLPEKKIIFCCFNNNYKILPETFNAWMDILNAVKDSVLWLSNTNSIAKCNIIYEAKKFNITSDRIIFASYLDNLDDHLSRISLADLFLDTLPYNAQTTASDALWAELPVLTKIGKSFSSRVASSLLKCLNLEELITSNYDEYIKKAIELGTNPKLLEDIRNKIRINKTDKSLFDPIQYTRNIEKAYKKMIFLYDKKLHSQDINIH